MSAPDTYVTDMKKSLLEQASEAKKQRLFQAGSHTYDIGGRPYTIRPLEELFPGYEGAVRAEASPEAKQAQAAWNRFNLN